jgi:tyrosyl-DNA phosphodiesterase-1
MKDFSFDQKLESLGEKTLYGYPSLGRALRTISSHRAKTESPLSGSPNPHVVCQVSSIATLPMTWLNQFLTAIFPQKASSQMENHFSIIYPTPNNVACSLDGYASGGSIHTKAQRTAHLKQISLLRRYLCQWTRGPNARCRANRDQAAPHVKTYVCFREKPTMENPSPDIDWAMLTSANLSTQAWGTLRAKDKEIVVQSYEIGVLVWPELFTDNFDNTEEFAHTGAASKQMDGDECGHGPPRLIPVFGQDSPLDNDQVVDNQQETLVGLRLPYDLPLTPYAQEDIPWSPQGTYTMLDRCGRRWPDDFFA